MYLLMYIPCCLIILIVIHALKTDDLLKIAKATAIDFSKITVALIIISAISYFLNR